MTYENISKLQYMENVVKETLRLHPSVIGYGCTHSKETSLVVE